MENVSINDKDEIMQKIKKSTQEEMTLNKENPINWNPPSKQGQNK